jgi:hypothetical protein
MQALKKKSTGRVTLFTATFAGDLERFLLQRESIERCGIDLPHVAAINTEDLDTFRRIPYQRNLTLVTTAQLLPRKLELRRLAKKYRLRDPRRWLGRRPLAGWWIQQLAKLNSPSVIQSEAIVSIDSDTFFVRPVVEDDFFDNDGRLHLYETRNGLTVTTCNWLGRSMHFLGVSTDQPARQYIHNPVPMHRQVILDMQKHIEKVHRKPWMQAMLKWGATEYCSYAVFAKHINAMQGLSLMPPPISLSYWTPKDAANFSEDFPAQLKSADVKIVCVQSHTGLKVADFKPAIEHIWNSVAAKAPRELVLN